MGVEILCYHGNTQYTVVTLLFCTVTVTKAVYGLANVNQHTSINLLADSELAM